MDPSTGCTTPRASARTHKLTVQKCLRLTSLHRKGEEEITEITLLPHIQRETLGKAFLRHFWALLEPNVLSHAEQHPMHCRLLGLLTGLRISQHKASRKALKRKKTHVPAGYASARGSH